VREGNEKDLEKFSELLDGIVVNLKDANQEAELARKWIIVHHSTAEV